MQARYGTAGKSKGRKERTASNARLFKAKHVEKNSPDRTNKEQERSCSEYDERYACKVWMVYG